MPNSPIPAEVLIAARNAVQRHFHLGEPWPGHNVVPNRCQCCNDAADIAARVAYQAGRESLLHVPNDIEATGGCCCNGCIGVGPCDLDVPERRNDWEVA
jgi:hypothetical protein